MKYPSPFMIESQEAVPLPKYEVHVTVDTETVHSLKQFQDVCKYLDVKPLYIENYTFSGHHRLVPQILTSSEIECHRYPTAYRYMIDIVTELELVGYRVIRRKIECHPRNERVSLLENLTAHYFEAHIKVNDTQSAIRSNLPISINNRSIFVPEAVNTEMVTFRKYGTNYNAFRDMLETRLKQIVYDMGPDGVETEFCLFDDNTGLDADWMQSYFPQEKIKEWVH